MNLSCTLDTLHVMQCERAVFLSDSSSETAASVLSLSLHSTVISNVLSILIGNEFSQIFHIQTELLYTIYLGFYGVNIMWWFASSIFVFVHWGCWEAKQNKNKTSIGLAFFFLFMPPHFRSLVRVFTDCRCYTKSLGTQKGFLYQSEAAYNQPSLNKSEFCNYGFPYPTLWI